MSALSPRHEKVHGLLPWQLYALAGMTGLFAAQYQAPALAMFSLLVLSMPREATWSCWRAFIESRWPFLLRSPWSFVTATIGYAPLVLTFALGWLYAHMIMANAMVHPLDTNIPPDKAQTLWITGKAECITGRIAAVDGLPDQRLRIILEDVCPVVENVRPVDGDSDASQNALPLRVVWTWEKPDLAGVNDKTKTHATHDQSLPMRPMVGERIQATLAIKPVDKLANPDSFDFVQFWAMQGVFYRAWSKGHMPEVTIISEARTDALWREKLRLHVDERLQNLVEHGFAGIGRDVTSSAELVDESTVNTTPSPNNTLRISAASIVMGMLFGDRYSMDSDLLNYFARTDLLHTLALSGQHLIIAGFFASICVFALRHSSKTLLLNITTKKLYYLLSLPCVCFYLWLGNAPPSLVRASTMLVFWIVLSCMSHRRATLPDALLTALAFILLISPLSIYDLGLQLSSIAVTALGVSFVIAQHSLRYFRIQPSAPLIALHHPVRTRLAAFAHRILYAALFLALSSIVIQLALVPIQLIVFGTASPWFFLNIIWIPVADLFVLPFIFLGLLFHALPDASTIKPIISTLHILGDFCFWLAIQACQHITMLLESMASANLLDYPAIWRPHWTSALGYAGIITCLVARVGRPSLPSAMRRLALASLALLLTGFVLMAKDAYNPRLRLTVFDVGMGQALYIRTPDNAKIMIDGGGFYSKRFDTGRDIIARALTHNQWPRLDMILNTHPDNDHLRGLIHLLRAFPVHYYGYNGDDNAKYLSASLQGALDQAALTPHTLLAGDHLDLGSHLALEILHPQQAEYDAGNNASLVARLVYLTPNAAPRGLAMLCGDVEAKGLRAILRRATASGADLSAEVLILPHHGAKGSYLPAFYDAVQPRLAIASCAKNHRYGYPNKAIRHDLEARRIPLLYTGQHGALYIDWNNLGEDRVVSWEGK